MLLHVFCFSLLLCALFYSIGQPRAVAVTQTVTICDGTQTNEYVPLAFYYFDGDQNQDFNVSSQFIIPSALLQEIRNGAVITGIKFFATKIIDNKSWTLSVRVGETTSTAISDLAVMKSNRDNLSLCYEGALPTGANTISLPITYTYQGSNLIIDLVKTNGYDYQNVSCYGVASSEGSSINSRKNNSSLQEDGYPQSFLPKMEITYEDGPSYELSGTPTFGNLLEGSSATDNNNLKLINPTTSAISASDFRFEITGAQAAAFSAQGVAVAANGEAFIPVTFSPVQAGTNTATMIVKVNGSQVGEPVTLTGEGTTAVTINQNAFNFGEYTVGKSAEEPVASLANASTSDINGTLSVTGPFSLPAGSTITIPAGATAFAVPVKYTPSTVGAENGELTINAGWSTFTVALSGTGVESDYMSTISGENANLGTVLMNSDSPVRTVTLKNLGRLGFTPVLTQPENNVFTVTGESGVLASGASRDYTITMNTSTLGEFASSFTITTSADEGDFAFSINVAGKVIEKEPTIFETTSYSWPINVDESERPAENVATLDEIATDPDQMIALLREVYMNKAIPGNKTRGYTAENTPDMRKGNVYYPAVGGMDAMKPGGNYDMETIKYSDAFGWNIPTQKDITQTLTSSSSTSNKKTYECSFDLQEYEPEKEGVTLLLVEMKDNVTPSYGTKDPTSYETLRSTIATQFKSVRVIRDFTTVGSGLNEATLFKVDCDNMNRFFFLAKGHLRTSAKAPYVAVNTGSGSGSTMTTQAGMYWGPFYWMYEQLSAYDLINSTEANDVYQALVAAKTYSVEHDCQSIPYVDPGHEFNMYGKTSSSADCQDVRDLMFIVPKYRMLNWDQRDTGTSDLFKNYNKDHRPSMGLFAIHQEPITGELAQNQENKYQLHLTWTSNLKDFFPDQNGKHIIYQVITNEDGTESYKKVGEVDQNTFNFDGVYMPQLEHGYQVTFAIQAQDADQFVTLQMSNKQSYIIPGTNKAEVLELTLNPDHTSRFNPAKEKNYYSNALRVRSYDLALKSSDLEGTTFKFYRTTQVPQKNEAGEYIIGSDTYPLTVDTDPKVFATATVSGKKLELNFTDGVEVAQTPENEFPTGKEGNDGVYAGYHTNPTTVPFSVDDYGYVTFTDFVIYDNFDESTAQNTHSSKHTYQVKLTRDAGYGEGLTELYSTVLSLAVPKTAMDMKGVMTFAQVNYDGADNHHPRASLSDGVEFDMNVHYSPKSEILAYYAYRWAEDDVHSIIDKVEVVDGVKVETDAEPQGQADNQMDYYTVTMGETQLPNVNVQQGQMAKAAFVDDFLDNPDNAGVYDYAPVVEMFNANKAKYDYYNTYGAPLKSTVKGSLQVEVDPLLNTEGHPLMSEYAWYDNGEWCSYYNIPLKFTALNIPDGYQLYKVRAWRQISDPSILREEISSRNVRKSADYLFEDMNYGFDMGNSEKMCKDNLLDYSLGIRPVTEGEFEPVATDGPIENETHATFGAKRMAGVDYRPGTLEELKAHFVVRAYFTRQENPALNQPIYVIGNQPKSSKWLPNHSLATLTSLDGKTYTGLFTPNDSGDGYAYFSFVNALSASATGWDDIKENRIQPEAATQEAPASNVTLRYYDGGSNSFKIAAGKTYLITISDFAARTGNGSNAGTVTIAEMTSSANGPRRAAALTPADYDYYVAEGECDVTINATKGIVTGISTPVQDRSCDVVGVTYVNPMGQTSSRPFGGVNIIVTRYSDGTTKTTKAVF